MLKINTKENNQLKTVKPSLHGAFVPPGVCNLIYTSFKKEEERAGGKKEGTGS